MTRRFLTGAALWEASHRCTTGQALDSGHHRLVRPKKIPATRPYQHSSIQIRPFRPLHRPLSCVFDTTGCSACQEKNSGSKRVLCHPFN